MPISDSSDLLSRRTALAGLSAGGLGWTHAWQNGHRAAAQNGAPIPAPGT